MSIKITASQAMHFLLDEYGIAHEQEYRFHSDRAWRFDFAIPEMKIAIEVEGGTYGAPVVCNNCGMKVSRLTKAGLRYYVREGGRHNRGKGFAGDREKYNSAVILGWKVLSFTTEQILREPKTVMNYILLLIEAGK